MSYLLTVIVPIYNEKATAASVIQNIKHATRDLAVQLIIVDDGSTDGTSTTLSQFASEKNVVMLKHETNQGKGAAIHTALPHAQGIYTIIQDADMEYNPAEYSLLLEHAHTGERAVYGSRNLTPNGRSSSLYYWGSKSITGFANFLFHARLTDINTAYKLFDTTLLRSLPLREKRFAFCEEATALLLARKINIKEVPISYQPRSFAEGKKIRWYNGFRAIWTLFRCRFFSKK